MTSRPRLARLVLQVFAAALVVWFLYRYAARNWDQVRRAPEAIDIHAGPLVAAVLVILLTYAMLIGAWNAVLRGWGERLPYGTAARIWCLSNLARYLPGRIWQIAGMAAMARNAGISPWAAAGSAVVVQLVNIATGTLVTFAFAPRFGSPLLVVLGGLVTACCAAALAWPAGAAWLSRALTRLTGKPVELRAVQGGPLLMSAAITALAWVAYGVALWLSIRGLTGRDIDPVSAVGVFTGAYVAGLINIFTPGGLGTREFILVDWLSGPLGPAAATVVTAGSRLLMTLTELLAAAATLPLLSSRPNAGKA